MGLILSVSAYIISSPFGLNFPARFISGPNPGLPMQLLGFAAVQVGIELALGFFAIETMGSLLPTKKGKDSK